MGNIGQILGNLGNILGGGNGGGSGSNSNQNQGTKPDPMDIFDNSTSDQNSQTNTGGNGLFGENSGSNSGGNSSSQPSEETQSESPAPTQAPQLPELGLSEGSVAANSGAGLLRKRTRRYIRGRFFNNKNVGSDIFGGRSGSRKQVKAVGSPFKKEENDSFDLGTRKGEAKERISRKADGGKDINNVTNRLVEMEQKLDSSKEKPGGFSPEYLKKIIKTVEETTDSTDSPKRKKIDSHRF